MKYFRQRKISRNFTTRRRVSPGDRTSNRNLDVYTTGLICVKISAEIKKCWEPLIRSRGRWNRETWQRGTISHGWTSRDLFQCSRRCSLQVYVWFREYYMSCSSVLCLFRFLSVLLLATCGRLSWTQQQPRTTNSRPRLLLRLPILTPLKLALLAQLAPYLF